MREIIIVLTNNSIIIIKLDKSFKYYDCNKCSNLFIVTKPRRVLLPVTTFLFLIMQKENRCQTTRMDESNLAASVVSVAPSCPPPAHRDKIL
jgi:hypothetical protein